ncbi:hypothetical protein [Actinomycetospora lemnae]|uniref:DUF5709 domain-containing protein n=1 Tax=Actinomycetospora lemnae TaxID=3019891 RepID=A0ABT5SRI8_9PSEU|nr:hypothetical protein [Actinomycetospora sp. DW7H6]MDD7965404.1 hypothetical protein [Actinomycetospora sp. DW7H6]
MDPDRARRNPQDAVDALEHRVLGGPEHRLDGGYPDDLAPGEQDDRVPDADPDGAADGSGPPAAALELDVDPEDQGSAAVAPRNPD